MSLRSFALPIFAGLTMLASSATASTVHHDFNNLNPGAIKGQAGGTGFVDAWGGGGGTTSLVVSTVYGDLTAPASTNYNVAQSGTGMTVRGIYTQGRSISRTLEQALSGDIWFSYLYHRQNESSRGGITFNDAGGVTSYTPDAPRILASGTALIVDTLGSGLEVTKSGLFAEGETSLVVGTISLDVQGVQDQLKVWVNPNVADIDNIAPDVDLLTNGDGFGSSIQLLGVTSYFSASGETGGLVDNVILSDDADAYVQVTGVPEPSSLITLAALSAMCIRRKK